MNNRNEAGETEMICSRAAVLFAAALLGVAMTGCTGQLVQTSAGPMPDYCTSNMSNVVSGAVVGTLLGAAIGAAAGGGRGAELGAAIGGMGGTLTGAQMDANCRQFAMQNFMQMMAQQAAAQRAAMAQGQMARVEPGSYLSYDYDAPSPVQGQPPVHHRFVQTGHYTNRATGEICNNVSMLSFANQQSTVTGTTQVCIGADGTPHSG